MEFDGFLGVSYNSELLTGISGKEDRRETHWGTFCYESVKEGILQLYFSNFY